MEQQEIIKILDEHKWGGSGIERETFEFILENFTPGSTILEIGAGYCSTGIFSKFYNVFSIEENENFCNIFHNNYIHAPIVNGWYDAEILKSKLSQDYSLIFIDGPLGSGNRDGFLKNINLFRKDVPLIVHDTYRESEYKLANNIALELNKKIEFKHNLDFFAYIF